MKRFWPLSLTVLIVAGCGGGEDSGGGLSEADYRKEANAICKAGIKKATDVPTPSSPDDLADYLEEVFALNDDLVEDFEALDPPESLQEDHDLTIENSKEQEKKFDEIVEKVRDSDDPQATLMSEFKELAPAIKKDIEVTRRLGLDECLKTPGATDPNESS